MVTYLLRHARTGYSARYWVNGRPELAVPLDPHGRNQCRVARGALPLDSIETCVVSQFARAAQTAQLLLAGRPVPLVVDGRLDEIDYGDYEGGPFLEYGQWLRTHGPWVRPPSARESQREAIKRMFEGLRGALTRPAPRLVVAHGLLLSVVNSTRNGGCLGEALLPEAPYVTAVRFTDEELRHLADRLIEQTDVQETRKHRPGAAESGLVDRSDVDMFNATNPLEDVDHHA